MAVDNRMVLLTNTSADSVSTNATALYALGGANAMLVGELAINTNTGVLYAGADPAGTESTAMGGKISNAADVLALTLSTHATTQAVGTGASPTFADLTIAGEINHSGDSNNSIAFGTDTQTFETGGSTRMDITDSGLQFGATGARITSVTNSDSLGTSDTLLCTQGNVKAYADTKATDSEAHAYVEANALTLTAALTMDGAHIIVPTGYDVQIADAPGSDTDAANKAYVDSVAQGLDIKGSTVIASTANISATYAHGAGTLTNGSNAAFPAVDGVTLATVGQRILMKNQTETAENGIYTLTIVGSGSAAWELTRATDMDAVGEIIGAFAWVEQGNASADQGFVVTTNVHDSFQAGSGNHDMAWTQFSGTGQITGGDGITVSSNEVSITDDGVDQDMMADNAIGIAQLAGIARGKLIIGDSSGDPALLAAGANGKILTADSNGDPSWTTMSGDVTSDAGALTVSSIGGDNVVLGGAFTTSGAYTTTLTVTGNTAVTLPTSGTIVTTDASQTLTNKSIVATQLSGTIADARMPDLTGDITTTAGEVATTLANNVVGIAQLAGIARGKLIVGDASGDPALLAAGANGKILTADSNGDPSWTTMSGDVTSSAGALTVSSIGGDNVVLGGAFTTSGAHTLTFTTGGNTAITLPTSGTLVTTTATQTLTNKTLSGGTF